MSVLPISSNIVIGKFNVLVTTANSALLVATTTPACE
jgi:hypothetical protein